MWATVGYRQVWYAQPYDRFPVVKTTKLSSKNLRFLGSILDTISKYSSVLSILAVVVASRGCWEIFFHVIPSLFRADHKIADSLGHSSRSQTPSKTITSKYAWFAQLGYLYILQNIIRDLWRCTSASPSWLNCSFVQKRSIIRWQLARVILRFRAISAGPKPLLYSRSRCSRSSGDSGFPLMYGLPWLFTNDISQFVQTKVKILEIFSKSRVVLPTISFLVWITSASFRELRWRVSSYVYTSLPLTVIEWELHYYITLLTVASVQKPNIGNIWSLCNLPLWAKWKIISKNFEVFRLLQCDYEN